MNPLAIAALLAEGWEEREHMIGAIGGLVEIGLNVWHAIRGEKDEESTGQLAVETEDGQSIPLVDVLKNHEERIQAVEKVAKKRPRRRKTR